MTQFLRNLFKLETMRCIVPVFPLVVLALSNPIVTRATWFAVAAAIIAGVLASLCRCRRALIVNLPGFPLVWSMQIGASGAYSDISAWGVALISLELFAICLAIGFGGGLMGVRILRSVSSRTTGSVRSDRR